MLAPNNKALSHLAPGKGSMPKMSSVESSAGNRGGHLITAACAPQYIFVKYPCPSVKWRAESIYTIESVETPIPTLVANKTLPIPMKANAKRTRIGFLI
jgi:hypothetical protein